MYFLRKGRMILNIFLVLFIYLLNFNAFGKNDDYIIVNKKNVLHKFVPFDHLTDTFVKYEFYKWENETFDVFDTVKDAQGIAIDLGAWIGTTAIWLSKNFYHVLAVDADRVSLECLKKNLKASECNNVSLCEKPIAKNNDNVIFGPRFNVLNESTSCILRKHEYTIQALTLQELVDNYIYSNPNIKSHKISFIKCDIEGGEEDIVDDILNFAYKNKVKVYLSFHLSWWKSKKISEYEYLFKYFKTNCPTSNVVEYIKQNPFTSLLFEPLDNPALPREILNEKL